MRIDVNAFLGSYPYRRVPGTSPDALLAAMDRTGIDRAWVSHLPGIFWRDPAAGNAWLYEVGTRAGSAPAGARGAPGDGRLGECRSRSRGCRSAGGALRSDVLRHRAGEPGDARARRPRAAERVSR